MPPTGVIQSKPLPFKKKRDTQSTESHIAMFSLFLPGL